MLKKILLVGSFILSFVAGGFVVYVALSPYYDGVRKKMTPSIMVSKKGASTEKAPSKESTKKESAPEEAAPTVALFPNQKNAPSLVPNPKEYAQIIDVLRSDYVDAPALVSHDLNAASLLNALAAAGPKVRISTVPLPNAADFLPMRAAKLPYDIMYWRVASFDEKGISRLLKAWGEDSHPKKGLVIDLRDFQAGNDYHGMADFAGLFIPGKTPLFSVHGIKVARKDYVSERQPLNFSKKMPLLVLINNNTRGAGELLARLLNDHTRAILVGQATAGEIAMYSEVRLGSGRFLRVSVANVILPNGKSPVGMPTEPEILVSTKHEEESALLMLEYKGDPADYIRELPTRRKFNEAGLVHEENAELDEMVEEQANVAKGDAGVKLRDPVLLNAVDVIRGIGVSFEPPNIPAPPVNK